MQTINHAGLSEISQQLKQSFCDVLGDISFQEKYRSTIADISQLSRYLSIIVCITFAHYCRFWMIATIKTSQDTHICPNFLLPWEGIQSNIFFLDAFFNLLQFSSCGSDTGLNQNCLASKSVVYVVLVCIIPNSPIGIKLLLFLFYTDKF